MLKIEGKILEKLPDSTYVIKPLTCADQVNKVITAHIAGKLRMSFIRLIQGDKVLVEVPPYDRSKGRIIDKIPERRRATNIDTQPNNAAPNDNQVVAKPPLDARLQKPATQQRFDKNAVHFNLSNEQQIDTKAAEELKKKAKVVINYATLQISNDIQRVNPHVLTNVHQFATLFKNKLEERI